MQQYYFEDMDIGMSAQMCKVISQDDVDTFADLSGDTNPLHLDAEFAAASRFRERIVHGSLTASLISAVIGTKLPGTGTIYVSQTLNFRAPVRPGERVTVIATVADKQEKRKAGFITMTCVCRVGDTVVLDGEALILLAKRG